MKLKIAVVAALVLSVSGAYAERTGRVSHGVQLNENASKAFIWWHGGDSPRGGFTGGPGDVSFIYCPYFPCPYFSESQENLINPPPWDSKMSQENLISPATK